MYETLGKQVRLEFSSWWRLTPAMSGARAGLCVCVPVGCVWITEEALAGITSTPSL